MSKIAKAMQKASGPAPAAKGKSGGFKKPQALELNKGHLERNRITLGMDNPEIADYYNLLRTQVLQRTRDQGNNVIMVTAATPGEGATLTAINLAISVAKELDQYCLLVDTHLRRAIIDDYLGIDAPKGLSDYLIKDQPIYKLTVNAGLEKLSILPAGDPLPSGSTEILGSPKMKQLVMEMKERYPDRYVIFNCPPLLSVPDALVFSSYVDATLLVVEARKTTRAQVKRCIELLKGKNLLGTVMNKSRREEMLSH